MNNFIKKCWPFLLFFIFFVFIFYKTFLKGLIPFPADLLVSWFFPYSAGGWQGYNPWTTHKEFIAADVVRQLYPWKALVIEIFKKGQIPLWNPYSFSGTPLLANLQSAPFYPFNFLFFIFSLIDAWVIYIFLQSILAFSFMYIFLRSLEVSPFGAILSGLSFAFMGYMIIWYELGVVGHAALWLPLVLWAIGQFLEKQKVIFLLVIIFSLAFSILAGHLQTTAYVFLVSFFYLLFKVLITNQKKVKKRMFFLTSFGFLLAIFLSAMQLLPSWELFLHSARDKVSSFAIFKNFQLPPKHLVTVFAPDFFGNPAVLNFWGKDYGEFMAYFGIVALFFALMAIFNFKKRKEIVLFFSLCLFALALAMPTPLSNLLFLLNVPVLSTGNPSRTLFIFGFSMSVLAGLGMQVWFSEKKGKRLLLVGFLLGSVYFLLFLFAIFGGRFFGDKVATNLLVARRNLVLPITVFLAALFLVLMGERFKKYLSFFALLLLFVATLEYWYFANKFLPFAKKEYVFPPHPLISYLKEKTQFDRVFGYETAYLYTNLPTFWHLYYPEGYDALYIKRYGELIAATKGGEVPQVVPRSDANFENTLPREDSFFKKRAMDLLGVRYVLDKNDAAKLKWEPEPWKFPQQRFSLLWQKGKFKVYENKKALPRVFLVNDYLLEKEKEKIIKILFSADFDPRKSLILEEGLEEKLDKKATGSAEILSYTPNKVRIKTFSSGKMLLFLSDNFYPGWQAFIDGKRVKIYRANYTFRAVSVPKGKHVIVFSYQPFSFKLGVIISLVTLVATPLFVYIFSNHPFCIRFNWKL